MIHRARGMMSASRTPRVFFKIATDFVYITQKMQELSKFSFPK